MAEAILSKKIVRVKGSPDILTPFLPTSFIVGERIEFWYDVSVFPPLISKVSNPFAYKVRSFVVEFVIEPIPCAVDIYIVLNVDVIGKGRLSTTTSFRAGIPPRLEGIAQNVPPCPSDVSVVRAGIREFVGVRAFTCRIVIISVSNVLRDIPF
jgi:hypothetical protein